MIIDKTLNKFHSYTYNLVQTKTFTDEVFNVGIILKDESEKTLTYFANITSKPNCIHIKEYEDINFLLKQIQNNIIQNDFNINNYTGFSISYPKIYSTDLSPQQALDSLVDTYISIKQFITRHSIRDMSIYDKRIVHKKLKHYAKEHNINNFRAGKHFKIAYKAIDLALVDSSEKPYSIAAMTSPHVDNFKDGFITNIFTLQESIKKSSAIKKSFLYAPVFDDVNSISKKSLSEHIGWAKEQAKEYKFDIFTDSRESAVMEMLSD